MHQHQIINENESSPLVACNKKPETSSHDESTNPENISIESVSIPKIEGNESTLEEGNLSRLNEEQ